LQGKEIPYIVTQSRYLILSSNARNAPRKKHNDNNCTRKMITKKHIEDERKNLNLKSNEIKA
jgi:hypothetical protein